MKKIVITNGLISGILVTAFMIYGVTQFYNNPDFTPNEIIGFGGMILSFIFIVIGIKNYRDKINNGSITFGKGFKIGFLIALIASLMYTITWMFMHEFYMPDFIEKYSDFLLEKAKNDNLPENEIQEVVEQIKTYKSIYSSYLGIFFMTMAEILPLGMIISLISALILKRKVKE